MQYLLLCRANLGQAFRLSRTTFVKKGMHKIWICYSKPVYYVAIQKRACTITSPTKCVLLSGLRAAGRKWRLINYVNESPCLIMHLSLLPIGKAHLASPLICIPIYGNFPRFCFFLKYFNCACYGEFLRFFFSNSSRGYAANANAACGNCV